MEQIAFYLAPIATTIAALIVASNLGTRVTGFGFIAFTVGSVCWALLGLATGQTNLLWQNLILTLLNLFGIWRWLGWKARVEEGAANAATQSADEPGETLFPVSLLTKGEVLSRDGNRIGHCIDAMAGCSSGRLDYLVVAEGGVAGIGERLRRLPWTGCSVAEEQVRTSIGTDRFEKLEPLEPDHWPAR